jgi:hypothetical protein
MFANTIPGALPRASRLDWLHFLFVLLAVLLLVSAGLVHGVLTNRWSTPAELKAAAARCENVPLSMGEWKGGPGQSIPNEAIKLAGIEGYVARRYTHPKLGEVHLLLVCGRPGPISVHTPDICFPAEGFKLVGKPRKTLVTPSGGEPSGEFWTAEFKSPNPAGPTIRAFWAWGNGGAWSAPGGSFGPRWGFGGSTYLYKLYVTSTIPRVDDPIETDPSLDFLNVLLPELRPALSPAP